MRRDQSKGNHSRYSGVARHCMVVHAYYPQDVRVQRQALALIEDGTEVEIICLQTTSQAAEAHVNGVQVYRVPVRRHKGSGSVVQFVEYLKFFALAFVRLARLHRRRRYDVIQVHNLPDFLVFVGLIPKLMGAKIILDLHDLMPEFYAERFQRSMDSLPVRMIRWQESLSCRFADHVITVTELWRQALIERGQPPAKVSVVMNVADGRFFYLDAASSAPDEGRFRLIYHGVMGRRNGLDLALKAISQVRGDAPNIHLTLHGWGEYRETLEALTGELGLQDHVQFSTSLVPRADLPQMLRAADLAIVPYRNGLFSGGILPTKLMEYAALGIPAIAARTPSISAYFDETMIEFFTPNDAEDLARCILTLYSDRVRLAQLAHGIQKFNQRYNWTEAGAEYVALVERLRSK